MQEFFFLVNQLKFRRIIFAVYRTELYTVQYILVPYGSTKNNIVSVKYVKVRIMSKYDTVAQFLKA